MTIFIVEMIRVFSTSEFDNYGKFISKKLHQVKKRKIKARVHEYSKSVQRKRYCILIRRVFCSISQTRYKSRKFNETLETVEMKHKNEKQITNQNQDSLIQKIILFVQRWHFLYYVSNNLIKRKQKANNFRVANNIFFITYDF